MSKFRVGNKDVCSSETSDKYDQCAVHEQSSSDLPYQMAGKKSVVLRGVYPQSVEAGKANRYSGHSLDGLVPYRIEIIRGGRI